MITDQQTNILYLSPLLKKKYPTFSNEFLSKLDEYKVDYQFLKHTKDIWCRDYMPIQLDEGKFVFSKYDPPYLKTPEERATISDNVKIVYNMDLGDMHISSLKIEGGNVVKSKNKVICTARIFEDNSKFNKEHINKIIIDLFEGNKVIIIPEQPDDWTGHADGMVRFIDDNTVLINDYSKEEDRKFVDELYGVLHDANLKVIEIPTSMYDNSKDIDATGIYVNYLQMGNLIFLPKFERAEDQEVEDMFNDIFKGHTIIPVVSNEITKMGGVLNCCTWNIKM